jgi:hypothetical protein
MKFPVFRAETRSSMIPPSLASLMLAWAIV